MLFRSVSQSRYKYPNNLDRISQELDKTFSKLVDYNVLHFILSSNVTKLVCVYPASEEVININVSELLNHIIDDKPNKDHKLTKLVRILKLNKLF